MCGFLFEQSRTENTSREGFQSLLSLSKRRGPDDQGYLYEEPGLQFGFNRLSILDTSPAGHQPMVSANGNFILLFNGEIYNHLELRRAFKEYPFRGLSDSETILASLERKGMHQTIQSLDGMFAMVIYDRTSKTIHLARDHAGIKPLFYGWNGHTLVAASQYNQIRNHPAYRQTPIDPEVLRIYLQQHFVPPPFGLYAHTYQVNPGEVCTFREGERSTWRYWELPPDQKPTLSDAAEAGRQVEEVLWREVKAQLLSDVPVGAFLSGGVDSPLICHALRQHAPQTSVFTIGSDSKTHDESERAAEYAKALGLPHHLWKLNAAEVSGYWNEIMESIHEPFADPSIVPTYLVSKFARQQVTVALSGDGGDELFFGYERFQSIRKNIRFHSGSALLRKAVYAIDKLVTGNKRVNSTLLYAKQAEAHERLHSRFPDALLAGVAPGLRHVNDPSGWNTYRYPNSTRETELLQHMRKAEFYGMMQKTLRKVDLASMGNSLEVRVPFLSKSVIGVALQIDPLLNLDSQGQKKILRQLLQVAIPQVHDNPVKKGFSVPLGNWIRNDLKAQFYDTLLSSRSSTFGFDRKAIEHLLHQHIHEHKDLKWPLFTLYTLLK